MTGWQARLFGKALGPVRPTRDAAYDDLVSAGHATQDNYAPHRIWPIVPAEVAQVQSSNDTTASIELKL